MAGTASPSADDSPLRWTLAKRTELTNWFRQRVPFLAPAYEGAVKLVEDKTFPGREHFIAHTVRDIADRLVYALGIASEKTRVDYVNHLNDIIKTWPSLETLGAEAPEPGATASVDIPYDTARLVDSLVQSHRARLNRPDRNALLFQQLNAAHSVNSIAGVRAVHDFKAVHDWFYKYAHLPEAEYEEPLVEAELQERFRAFENILHSYVGSFFTGAAELDTLLAANDPATASRVVPMLSSPQHEDYFFSRLQDATWITPLLLAGAFKFPPPAIRLSEGSTSFPFWPPSRYLARMAPLAPSEVVSVLKGISTDNQRIVWDVVRAGVQLPPSKAKELVQQLSTWASAGKLDMAFIDAAKLVVHLTHGGETQSALRLSNVLFSPRSDTSAKMHERTRYWYTEGLTLVVPVLIKTSPGLLCRQLCNWLQLAIQARKYTSGDAHEDYSTTWRPAIEDHEQNHDYELTAILVTQLRMGLEAAIVDGWPLLDAQSLIASFKYSVFRRLRLYLYDRFPALNSDKTRQAMLDRAAFDDYRLVHEYAMLVGHHFTMFTAAEKAQWLGWIDAGPDMSDFDEGFRSWRGQEPTPQDRQDRIDYWKFGRLHWVRAHLEDRHKRFYDNMLQQHGEPDFADMATRMTTRWGHDSPISAEELSGHALSQALAMISNWQPSLQENYRGKGIEGLAGAFASYLSKDAARFSKDAPLLQGRPAIYVRSFLSRMTESLKKGETIDVPAVLDLCEWVVRQPVHECTTPASQHERLADPDWQWSRNAVSDFVESICRLPADGIATGSPDALRPRIWQLLFHLAGDNPDSSVLRDTSADDPRTVDYIDLGINSSRGRAIQAVLEYARWWATHVKVVQNGQEVIPSGFEALPEVREVLEAQIVTEHRRVEVLSVIGSHLNLIYWIDREWLAKHAEVLFDLEGLERTPRASEGWAAWNAFLVWVRPHFEFYRLFKGQFAYAVKQICDPELKSAEGRMHPVHHLAEHLMLLYGRGDIDLDSDAGLLKDFMLKALPEARRHAIGFMGRSLSGNPDPGNEVIQRFQRLWDLYWPSAGKADALAHPQAWSFGYWYTSELFPQEWVLPRLLEFAELVGVPEPDHDVANKLAQDVTHDIGTKLRILVCMVKGDKEGWRVEGWKESARSILKAAIDAGEPHKQVAVDLINLLGRRGYVSMGDLLPR